MQSELINPFLVAVSSVVEMVLGKAPARGEPRLEKASFTTEQVNVFCGVTGEVVGQVMLGMSLQTADRIASAMIGQKVSTFDQLAASAIAELANMTCGNGLLKLSELGFNTDLTPPTIIKGSQVQISTLAIPAIAIPFTLAEGELVVTIALHRSK
jgi:chemotaxis protein CheX